METHETVDCVIRELEQLIYAINSFLQGPRAISRPPGLSASQ